MAKPGQNSEGKRPTLQMIISLAGFIAGVLAQMSFEQVQYLLSKKNIILRKKLQEVFNIVTDPHVAVREEWQKFYADYFKVTVDFSGVVIPAKPTEGSWRLVFISMGLSMNATLAVMRSVFKKVSTYQENLDGNVPTNTRKSDKSYAVWVRVGVEPDEKYLGKSTREADMAGTIGTTLLERLVLGVKTFVENGSHLDVNGVTICTGSRDSGGYVPYVCFYPYAGGVCVRWYDVGCPDAAGGLREAVS